jgi:penicillin-insensitive murein endopeptidase
MPARIHVASGRRRTSAALAAVLAAVVIAAAGAAETPWSRIDTVASGRPTAIGGPSNGCIRGADALPASGRGFVSIRRHRNRFYGHPETLRLIRDLGAEMQRRNGRLIMIGDLSQPRGGRMSSSHVSHQNGLDADIWLTLADSPEQAWRSTPEDRDPPSMLGRHGLQPSEGWGPDQVFLVRSAAEDPAVDRILVNPGIKRALCRSEGDASWLRKLRPWWGHDAHMHVRLKCPPGNGDCIQQAPIPMGSGCGSELAWWFSLEAQSPRSSSSKPKPRPAPPAACRAMLTES